ncbi:MAG: SDR family NAD(P)-dependent oxidoreductase [Lachnospiraceae bacterium]
MFICSGVGVTGFHNISPYVSPKGAIESLAKCLSLEYKDRGISFHIIQPPLTRTKSTEPFPIPKDFLANPQIVGRGLARLIHKNSYCICHSVIQQDQTKL